MAGRRKSLAPNSSIRIRSKTPVRRMSSSRATPRTARTPRHSSEHQSNSRDSVKVISRFRPMNAREKKRRDTDEMYSFTDSSVALNMNHRKTIDALRGGHTAKSSFAYDKVFDMHSTQEKVFEATCDRMVEDLFKGINCSVLAYGQTGSGKTFTMMGEKDSPGIIPRLVQDVYSFIDEHYENDESKLNHYAEVYVSYVEIYLEHVKDLVKPQNKNLRIREDSHGIWIEGVCETRVMSEKDVMEVMERGTKNRAIASTNMNAQSSRSHSVFLMKVRQLHKDNASTKQSKLILVDLAGSEKVENTGASGQTLKEAQQINKSLSALGNVIHALTSTKTHHIPYRDSKLTRILSDSLGGNSRTCIIVTASPAAGNIEETLSTLRFASRAKMVKNKPKVNENKSLGEYKRLLKKAKAEVEELKRQLQAHIDVAASSDSGDQKTIKDQLLALNEAHAEEIKVLVTKHNTAIFETRTLVEGKDKAIMELTQEYQDKKIELNHEREGSILNLAKISIGVSEGIESCGEVRSALQQTVQEHRNFQSSHEMHDLSYLYNMKIKALEVFAEVKKSLDASREEHVTAKERVKGLEAELSKKASELKASVESKEKAFAQVSTLEDSLKAAKEAASKATERAADLERKTKEQQMAERSAFATAEKSASERVTSLEASLATSKEAEAKATALVKGLRAELSEKGADMQSFAEAKQKAAEELEKSQLQVAKLSKSLASSEDELERGRTEIATLRSSLQEIESKVSSRAAELEKKMKTAEKASIEAFKAADSKSQKRIADLEAMLARTSSELEAAKRKNSELKEEVSLYKLEFQQQSSVAGIGEHEADRHEADEKATWVCCSYVEPVSTRGSSGKRRQSPRAKKNKYRSMDKAHKESLLDMK